MDGTAFAQVALMFDNSTPDTAAAGVVQALVSLQQTLANTPGKNPMSSMTLVQMAAAATGLPLLTPVSKPHLNDHYSPELTLTFALAPIHSLANIELAVPAIGPEGACGDPTVTLNGFATASRAIEVFNRLWLGIMGHLASLVDE